MQFVQPTKFVAAPKWIHYTSGAPYIVNPTEWDGQALITLSYDDGRLDNYTTALQLHEKYKVPATFHIIADRMEWTREYAISNEYMHQFEVWDADRRGVEISSHSYSHPRFADITHEEVLDEFHRSKAILEQYTETPVVTLAVPHSAYSQETRDYVAGAVQGYIGVRVYGAVNEAIPPTDRWWLKSALALTRSSAFEDAQTLIDDAVAEKQWCILMLHRINNYSQGSDIAPELLEKILQYITTFSELELLPVNMRDGLKFALGLDYDGL